MLEILKHERQKFCWGFAPDTVLDITVLSHTVLWSSVVYCSSISSFEGLILMSIKSQIFELITKCHKMLEIFKHKMQKFRLGFAPDTILDIKVLSQTVLWSSVVYCSSISSFEGLIFMSIKNQVSYNKVP